MPPCLLLCGQPRSRLEDQPLSGVYMWLCAGGSIALQLEFSYPQVPVATFLVLGSLAFRELQHIAGQGIRLVPVTDSDQDSVGFLTPPQHLPSSLPFRKVIDCF